MQLNRPEFPSPPAPVSLPPSAVPVSAPSTSLPVSHASVPHSLPVHLPPTSVSNIGLPLPYHSSHISTSVAKPLHSPDPEPQRHRPTPHSHELSRSLPLPHQDVSHHKLDPALEKRTSNPNLYVPSNIPAVTSLTPIPNLQHGLQSLNALPAMNSFSSMPSMPSMPPMPTMSTMPSLHHMPSMPPMPPMPPMSTIPSMAPLLQPQEPLHHPLSAGALGVHVSSDLNSPGILSGAVHKRRKSRKSPMLTYDSSILSSDDATTMMMAAHHASHIPSPADAAVAALTSSHPVYEADGIQFKLLSQLPDQKIKRLRDEKIKPIEDLTFTDIKTYNRNQLRAYCSVYGIRRKKKADMERDMARYAALFHPNDAEYDIGKFKPTEYAEGPIPRRKVPVTKAEKEKAAGDLKQLTSALQQRPHSHALNGHYSSVTSGAGGHSRTMGTSGLHALGGSGALGGSFSNRFADVRSMYGGTGTGMGTGTGGGGGGHMTHNASGCGATAGSSLGASQTHGGDEHDAGTGISSSELLSVPEMHVPNHLLSISHAIGDE